MSVQFWLPLSLHSIRDRSKRSILWDDISVKSTMMALPIMIQTYKVGDFKQTLLSVLR